MTDEQIEQAASGAAAEIAIKLDKFASDMFGIGLAKDGPDSEGQRSLMKSVKRIVAKHIAKAVRAEQPTPRGREICKD